MYIRYNGSAQPWLQQKLTKAESKGKILLIMLILGINYDQISSKATALPSSPKPLSHFLKQIVCVAKDHCTSLTK